MKTHHLFAVSVLAGLLAPAPLFAEDEPAPQPAPPVAISRALAISPEHFQQIALEKPIAVADGLRITHMAIGRFDPSPATAESPESSPSPAVPSVQAPGVFVPAKEIPLVPMNAFGWVIRFDTNRDTLTLSEDFVLPSPITISSGGNSSVISDDGKTATTPRDFPYIWDWAFNFWYFDEGDPVGEHEFRIHLGETQIAQFKFNVVEP